jgi:CO/xanthine dehydrogenase Mo-binding subunit
MSVIPYKTPFKVIGQNVIRVDMVSKCTGTSLYTGDMEFPGMLEGMVLKSAYAHARINSIDTAAAEKLPGVVCTVVGKRDEKTLPPKALSNAYYPLASTAGEVFFAGQGVALVAAETRQVAEEALKLIEVDYTLLPAVYDPKEALQPNAPVLHPEYQNSIPTLWPGFNRLPNIAPSPFGNIISRKGQDLKQAHKGPASTKADTEQGKKEADIILSAEYTGSAAAHCQIEPHQAVARWDNDELTIWASIQDTHAVAGSVSGVLGIPQNRIRVIAQWVGGGFGGKNGDSAALIAIYAAALSKKARRPVRLVLQPDENTILPHHSCGPFYYNATGGITKDGRPTFLDTVFTVNNGGVSGALLNAAYPVGEAAAAVYRYDSIYCEAWPVWCNLNLSGQMRSYGDAEGMLCSEQFIDEMLEKINADPVEWRKKWADRPGAPCTLRLSWAEFAGGNYAALIDKVANAFGWKNKWKGWKAPTAVIGPKRRGVGCSLSMHITGAMPDRGMVKINPDGTVEILVGLMDIGQGIKSAGAQCVAEVLGVRYEDVRPCVSESLYTSIGGSVYASRGTPNAIGASVSAAWDARKKLMDIAAVNLKTVVDQLDIGDGKVFIKSDPTKFQKIGDIARSRSGIIGEAWENWPYLNPDGFPLAERECAVGMCEVEVDTETGKIDVLNFVCAADCGNAINPDVCVGQIEGGIVFGLGFAMHGELVYDKAHQGMVMNASPVDCRIPTFLDLPDITPILHQDPADAPTCQFNAKGIGEGTNVPVAPAIANAVYNACGIRLRNHPFTPDKVLKALGKI